MVQIYLGKNLLSEPTTKTRRSHQLDSLKKAVLKNFGTFTGKQTPVKLQPQGLQSY